MMTQAQALYDFRYNKVKLASKPKVTTAYGPPRCPESWDSRHIGCLLKGLLVVSKKEQIFNLGLVKPVAGSTSPKLKILYL